MAPEERKKALIVVRTYPVPSKKGVEVSCTAAITDKGEWLRLFPVPWRYLESDQRFRKYQWIDVTVTKASDARPESYKLKPDSIKILSSLGTEDDWAARKQIIFPLRSHCLCCLKRQRDAQKYPTLGIFRPRKIERLIISNDDPTWSDSQLAALRQGHLFDPGPKTELEKIPFKFQYEFWCECPTCTGHTLICIDWEMGQSWRKWRDDYGNKWEEKFRLRYETEMIQRYDTHFYAGTVHQYPDTWIVIGLFYPPRSQPDLFASPPPTPFQLPAEQSGQQSD
jgi:hypothetical protein